MAPPNKQTTMMDQARKTATFDSKKLSGIIFGSPEIVARRRLAFSRVERILGTNDPSKLPHIYGNVNREEAFVEGLKAGRATFEDGIDNNHDFFETTTERYALINASPFGLHIAMFIPTLKMQCTDEQRAYWLPLAESGRIIGAYCQTELGVGSFVRGIQTTATFDRKRDEFVIHSPTIESTKFWPGSIGFSCSHAIVMARLIVMEKDHGVHPFIVQFRSLKDYTTMPGIRLGDIGLKMSYNGTDNGYASFDHVRVPRMHLLMGNASLSRDGTYMKATHDKLSYSTMIYGRTLIIRSSAFQLAQASTIAMRYSHVREQGLGPNGGLPHQVAIITYKSQHFRLLSLISKCYAIHFAWRVCDASYWDLKAQQSKNDHSALPYNHTIAAGLKAWATRTAADGAEDARKCCGGQGYVMTSGLPEIVAAVAATATLEGENWVLWQQVFRYLLKGVTSIKAGKSTLKGMEYIAEYYHQRENNPFFQPHCAAYKEELRSPQVLISIYSHRASRLVLEAVELLFSDPKIPQTSAWNRHMMSLIRAACAHIDLFVLSSFASEVNKVEDSAIRPVLDQLLSLSALTSIISPTAVDAISFVEDGYLNMNQLHDARNQTNHLLSELLPNGIALTDAWDFTDASLCSAIGQYDGNAYETLMTWTKQLPINVNADKTEGVFLKGFQESIRPVLRRIDALESQKNGIKKGVLNRKAKL